MLLRIWPRPSIYQPSGDTGGITSTTPSERGNTRIRALLTETLELDSWVMRAPHPNTLKTHCPKGHPYLGSNLYVDPKGNRRCRACKEESLALIRTIRPPKPPKPPKPSARPHSRDKTHCPRGHPYLGTNLYVDPKGNRRCRTCKARWLVNAHSSPSSVVPGARRAHGDESAHPGPAGS